jgi:tryptophan-rich sensory protein
MIGFAVAVTLVATVGTLAVSGTRATYARLDLPSWAPPGWLFGPVWSVLYVTIAVAGWLVWRREGWSRQLVPYGVQLVLNAVWTPLFFGANRFGLALLDIIALWVTIGVTVFLWWRHHRPAAALLLPYWAWVTFATLLNTAIWWTN